jgi:hypothetical protein
MKKIICHLFIFIVASTLTLPVAGTVVYIERDGFEIISDTKNGADQNDQNGQVSWENMVKAVCKSVYKSVCEVKKKDLRACKEDLHALLGQCNQKHKKCQQNKQCTMDEQKLQELKALQSQAEDLAQTKTALAEAASELTALRKSFRKLVTTALVEHKLPAAVLCAVTLGIGCVIFKLGQRFAA